MFTKGKTQEAVMCIKFPKPTQAENQAAAEQRVEAEGETQKAVQQRAQQKAEDVDQAISKTTASRSRGAGGSGGSGRRSLFRSASGGAGFLSRFDL
jgi:hypothetical protein